MRFKLSRVDPLEMTGWFSPPTWTNTWDFCCPPRNGIIMKDGHETPSTKSPRAVPARVGVYESKIPWAGLGAPRNTELLASHRPEAYTELG